MTLPDQQPDWVELVADRAATRAIEKHLEHCPTVTTIVPDHEARLRKVEKVTISIILAVSALTFLLPIILPWIMKAMAGQ